MQYEFSLTQDHIDNGIAEDTHECVVALCIIDNLNLEDAEVDFDYLLGDGTLTGSVTCHPEKGLVSLEITLTEEVLEIASRFDNGEEIAPCDFVLDIPKSLL